MDADQVQAYLERIGASAPAVADAQALRELHLKHLMAVPFENLSIHLGEPVVLDPDALYDKIVRRRRGGFCYELNGLFARLLEALGFSVSLLSAKVFAPDGTLGPPFDHMVVLVELDQQWLADVGFGRHARFPLLLTTGPQFDAEGEFTLDEAAAGDLEVRRDGTPVYLVEGRRRELSDFRPTCWWQATSPESHFTKHLTCSLPTASGRITLSGTTLYETDDDERTETELDEATALNVYRVRFGIELDALPTLRGQG